MNDGKLEQLKKLALAATPGPWDYKEIKGFPTVLLHNKNVDNPWFDVCCEPEAMFVASANPAAILKLLDENEKMRGCLEYIAFPFPDGRDTPNDVCQTRNEILLELANERLLDVSKATKCLAEIDKVE